MSLSRGCVRMLASAGLLAFVCAPAWGAPQSLTLTTGTIGTFTLPNSAIYRNVTGFHIDTHIHNWVIPSAGCTSIFFTGQFGFGFRMCAPGVGIGPLQFCDGLDVFNQSQGNCVDLDPTGLGDVLVRAQRDNVNSRLTLELWKSSDSSVYRSATLPINILTPSSSHLPDGGSVGNTPLQLAFFRWYSGLVALGSTPPSGSGGADLGDWEFNNSLQDSSGHGLNITLPGATYVSTPLFPPICNAGSSQSFRAGFMATLDGSKSVPLDEGSTLTYQWQTLTPTMNLDIQGPTFWRGSQNVMSPLFEPVLSGSYSFQLTITDGSGLSSVCTVQNGAVATDENDIVITGNPTVDLITGPLIRSGGNPWPWYDDRNRAWADLLGGLQSDANHIDVWNTALPGTLTATNGSAIVTGSGTSFQTTFCSGGTTWDGNTFFVIWDPQALAVGGTGRRYYDVASCTSQTEIKLGHNYFGATSSGLSYALWNTTGAWINGSENINYYDNVFAFYALYYRTGIATYRDYARTLADRWFTMPAFNQGLADCNVDACLAPRIVAYTGLVLRALDGRPDMWPGLRAWTDTIASGLLAWNNDIREDAYRLSVEALCGIADPDPTHQATCQTRVANSVANVWQRQQLADGSWTDDLSGNSFYVVCSWCGTASGTVSVTNGSTTVTGTGTGWTSSPLPAVCATNPCSIWLSPTSASPATTPAKDNSGGDTTTFGVSWVDSTHLTLSRPYDGSLAGSGRGYQIGALLGWGTQPFMMGVVSGAMKYAYHALDGFDPTNAARAKQFSIDAIHWMIKTGLIETYMGHRLRRSLLWTDVCQL